MYPKIKFQLNKKLDKEVCKGFLHLSVEGLNFGKEILKIHPGLKEKKPENYIDWYYKTHRNELLKKKKNFEKLWRKAERDFFDKTDKIFKGHQWPKGKYICYLSIFSCGPRFLQNKTFQSFYKYSPEILIQQIIHEMLHFMFYDYLYKKFPKYKAKKYKQKIWKISEAFNYIIQNQKEWTELFGKPILAYPKLKKLVQKTQKTWLEKKDIDCLLKKILSKHPF